MTRMFTWLSAAACLALILGMAACSPSNLGIQNPSAWAASMEGRELKDLSAGLGPHQSVEDLGAQGKRYVWTITQADHTPTEMRRGPARDGRPVFVDEYRGPQNYNTGRLTLWVDPTGKVYRSRWESRRTTR